MRAKRMEIQVVQWEWGSRSFGIDNRFWSAVRAQRIMLFEEGGVSRCMLFRGCHNSLVAPRFWSRCSVEEIRAGSGFVAPSIDG